MIRSHWVLKITSLTLLTTCLISQNIATAYNANTEITVSTSPSTVHNGDYFTLVGKYKRFNGICYLFDEDVYNILTIPSIKIASGTGYGYNGKMTNGVVKFKMQAQGQGKSHIVISCVKSNQNPSMPTGPFVRTVVYIAP
jgi:hypothetical protein